MADSTTIIAAQVKVDTGNSTANVNDLNKSLETTQKDLANVGAATTTTGKAADEATGHFSTLKDSISGIPGPLAETTEGVGKLSDAFKALLANPVALTIVAIVGALALLYKGFTNSFEGGEKMEQVFAGIKAAAQAVLDTISNLAGAVVKLFHGDFSGAFDQATKAVSGFVDNVVNAYDKMSELTKQAQELAREQADNDLDQAKRQQQLAELRAQAYDDSVPVAKRLALLKQLKDASEQNAKDDMDLAKRVADNKIAQLTVEEDGAKKNYVEIQKIRSDQIKNATENANELRTIGRQITQAQKEEQADRKAAHDKAIEDAKKAEENYAAYIQQLEKIKQDAQLASITDAREKESVQLSNRLADQQKAFDQELAQHKINREQYNELTAALAQDGHAQRQALSKKFADEDAKAEQDYLQKLADLRNQIALDGITNQFDKERLQLQIEYQKELADAEKTYANNAAQLAQYKAALDAKYAADKARVDQKQRQDAAKTELADAKASAKAVIESQDSSTKDKLAALDTETSAVKKAYADQTISAAQYTSDMADFSKARKAIIEQEIAEIFSWADKAKDVFDNMTTALGEQTAAGKAFAVASATISTIESAVKSYNAFSAIPIVGPELGFIAAAAALAAGYANVKKILAVEVPGQGSGGSAPATDAAIPKAPVAPTQSSTSLDSDSINAVGNAAAGGVNQQPVRAYVVESDNSAAANRAARLEGASRLGGQ
jgi:hypothetical protein